MADYVWPKICYKLNSSVIKDCSDVTGPCVIIVAFSMIVDIYEMSSIFTVERVKSVHSLLKFGAEFEFPSANVNFVPNLRNELNVLTPHYCNARNRNKRNLEVYHFLTHSNFTLIWTVLLTKALQRTIFNFCFLKIFLFCLAKDELN